MTNPPHSSAWPADRVAEARAVIADVAHHSDLLIRLACNVLAQHGETPGEREADAPSRTGDERSGQNGVCESAGDEAPQHPQRQRLLHRACGQEAPRRRLDPAPQHVTDTFDRREQTRETGEIEPERDQHQVGQHIERHLHRQHAVVQQAHGTQEADRPADRGVGADAPDVVGQVQRPMRPAGSVMCLKSWFLPR